MKLTLTETGETVECACPAKAHQMMCDGEAVRMPVPSEDAPKKKAKKKAKK